MSIYRFYQHQIDYHGAAVLVCVQGKANGVLGRKAKEQGLLLDQLIESVIRQLPLKQTFIVNPYSWGGNIGIVNAPGYDGSVYVGHDLSWKFVLSSYTRLPGELL